MLIKLFLVFLKIGAFSIGGGYAIIPIVRKEVVEERGWMTDEDFIDGLALSQGAPGSITINLAIFIGYRLKGVLGALVCFFGSTIPSFLIMVLVGKFFHLFKDIAIVEKAFRGIRPAIVGLIASAVYGLVKTVDLGRRRLLIAFIVSVLIGFFNVNPVLILVFSGIIAVIVNRFSLDYFLGGK